MSICIRTISNKLTPFVGTRKPITQLDRQLPKHVKESSAFFQELYAGATVRNAARERANSFKIMIKPLTTSENIVAWDCKLRKESDWNIVKNKDIVRTFSAQVSASESRDAIFMSGQREKASQLENNAEETPENPSSGGQGRPSQEQLLAVHNVLSNDLPLFFVRSIDYSIYHPMIEFENNFKGTISKGIHNYIKLAAMLRIMGHVRYAYVKFEILKITIHPEDSSVKVRWRIRGLPGYKFIYVFLRYNLWNLQPNLRNVETWTDGFSTYYVDGSGKVTRHVVDKMMPDQDDELSSKEKTNIAAKLALFLGILAPPEFFFNTSKSMKFKRDAQC